MNGVSEKFQGKYPWGQGGGEFSSRAFWEKSIVMTTYMRIEGPHS